MSIHTNKVIALILLIPKVSLGAIAFDATASNFTAPPGSSISWTHTCTGSQLVLYVGVNVKGVGSGTTGVTYNSVAMTLIGTRSYASGNGEVTHWYLINPATGANTIVVTFAAASSGGEAGSISLTGVDQTSPLDANNCNSGIGTAASVAVTTVADNAWVLDIFGQLTGSTSEAPGGSQTLRWDRSEVTAGGGGSSQGPITPPASTTMSWSIFASSFWAECATSFKPFVASVQLEDPNLLLMRGTD